jgi:hypothetical protein
MFKVEGGGSAYGARLVATQPLTAGTVIHRIADYRITPHPTYQTIQIGPNTHINELGMVAYLNHSCAPNTIIDTSALTISAVQDISAGADLTFFYASTEWEMERPFICLCGAPQCVRLMAGAKHLSVDTLSRYFINAHIRAFVLESLGVAALAQ